MLLSALALLIGRARELDRRELLNCLLQRISAKRTQRESDRPLFIVSTQCVEAGADLDFDGLVTQIAPLDCLRQRFGRLNRLGRPVSPAAAVLATTAEIAARASDPIYGAASATTWRWLQTQETGRKGLRVVDFGI